MKYFCCSLLCCMLACSSVSTPGSFDLIDADTPQVFAPGHISTNTHDEFGLSFDPDGKTIYFSRRLPGEKQQLYTTSFSDGGWTPPQRLSISTDRDENALVSPDGQTLYFGSERPIPGRPNGGNFDMNLWQSRRTDTGEWGEPTPLPSPINEVQREGERWPLVNNSQLSTADGTTFYYTTQNRERPGIELYEVDRNAGGFGTPRRIEGLFDDPKHWINAASISPDGRHLVFNSYGAPGGSGGEDVYVSRRTANGWSPARPLPVNSAKEESGPVFSPDGNYFFFTRTELDADWNQIGTWDIYYVRTESLGLDSLFDGPN